MLGDVYMLNAHSPVNLTSAEISLGICPVKKFEYNSLQCKPAEYVLIRTCHVACQPIFFQVKKRARTCSYVTKTHTSVNFVRADISSGISPIKALSDSNLPKQLKWMSIKAAKLQVLLFFIE